MMVEKVKELIFGRLCEEYRTRGKEVSMEPEALRVELGVTEELFYKALEHLRGPSDDQDFYIAYDIATRRIKLGSSWIGRCEELRERRR